MPALYYNAAMKISMHKCFIMPYAAFSFLYTQNNEFILNALLECIKFLTVHMYIAFNLPKMFY